MKTYSDKIKFVLDYVIIFGTYNEEVSEYNYELSRDEHITVKHSTEEIAFFMFEEELARVHYSASQFNESEESVIDIFSDNLIGRLPKVSAIPDNVADKIREATMDAQKDWDGITVIREKDNGLGAVNRLVQINPTGSCLYTITGYINKNAYFIRFCTGDFYDLSDPVYERLFNKG